MESLPKSRILKHCISWKWARWLHHSFVHSFIHSLHYLVPDLVSLNIYDRWRQLLECHSWCLSGELGTFTSRWKNLLQEPIWDSTTLPWQHEKEHSKKHKCMFRNTTNQIVKQKTLHLGTHSHALASFCWCKVKFYSSISGPRKFRVFIKSTIYSLWHFTNLQKVVDNYS